MLAAWPFGLLLAYAFYRMPHPWYLSCPRGDTGPCESSIFTWLLLAFWVFVAIGPGLMATSRWRRVRDAATEER
jgi:hypothetical protein